MSLDGYTCMCLNYLEVGIPASKLEIRTRLCCLVILRGVPISHDIYPARIYMYVR